MYHLQIAKALKNRMSASHVENLIRDAERALVVGQSSKVELSPHELLALAGELIEHRRNGSIVEPPTIYKPFSGARCIRCKGIVVHYKGTRRMSHPASTCNCEVGREELGEPFDGQTPVCDCGVSKGLRTDHESQCAAAYFYRPQKEES